MVRVLFVCMGNICRSPAGEAVFQAYVEQEGLDEAITTESAGTIGEHAGERPDPRMIRAGTRRGYQFKTRARKFRREDFGRYDAIITMDSYIHETVLAAASSDEEAAKVRLMGEFHPDPDAREVPDPYYGAAEGFELVLDLLEIACRGLLDDLVKRHGLDAGERKA